MDELKLARDGACLEITLDRPERLNALSAGTVDALLRILADCAADGTRLVVLRGSGASFCSGFDLGDIESLSDGDLLWRMVRLEMLLQCVCHTPYVTLGLAHGRVVGGGVDLFAACTLRIAAPGTSFRMPGFQFGVALGTRRLVERVGADAARGVLLETRTFDAEHAERIGLVQEIVESAAWPQTIAAALRTATTLTPQAVKDLLGIAARDTRAEDMAALVTTAAQPGLKERILAFRARAKAARAQPVT